MTDVIDPIELAYFLWPDVVFYDKQVEIIDSVENNDETYVPAGNMLGKDYVAGYIALSYFLRYHPVKIVTTSVTEPHLDVLWGEIDRFIRTAKYPLTADKGGPLLYTHHEIRKVLDGELQKDVYLKGVVATTNKKGEGLSGHHSAHTLLIVDEASGVDDIVYTMGTAWAKRILIIGNPHPTSNFFRKGVKAGDLLARENNQPQGAV